MTDDNLSQSLFPGCLAAARLFAPLLGATCTYAISANDFVSTKVPQATSLHNLHTNKSVRFAASQQAHAY